MFQKPHRRSPVVWRDVFVESPCEEVGFSSYLWPSRRCAWSPAFPLHGLSQMWHTSPVGAACVCSLQRSQASCRSVIRISSQAAAPSNTFTHHLMRSNVLFSQSDKPRCLVTFFGVPLNRRLGLPLCRVPFASFRGALALAA